jgi:hypothetical protein
METIRSYAVRKVIQHPKRRYPPDYEQRQFAPILAAMEATPTPEFVPLETAEAAQTGTGAQRAGGAHLNLSLLGIAIALGLGLELLGPPWVRSIFSSVQLGTPGFVPAMLAALLAAVILHEAGHLVAAYLLNFEILGISLGPWRLQRLHGRNNIQFSGMKWLSCAISAVPRDMGHWHLKMMIVVAAGPGATLLAGIAASFAAATGRPESWPTLFWSLLAQFNFFLFVLGLVPNGSQATVRNDATLFLTVMREGCEAEEIRLYHRVAQLTLEGLEPSYYPESLLRELATRRGRADFNVLSARTMTEWALDSGDLRLAEAWDRQALKQSEKCDARVRNAVLASSACFDLLFREDLEEAHRKLASVDTKALFPPSFAYRVSAARLLAEGKAADVPRQVIRAQYALPLGVPYYNFERKLLERLHLKALAALPPRQASCYTTHAA